MTTKAEMLEAGIDNVESFCEFNGLRTPEIIKVKSSAWRFSSTCAYYRPENIHICVDKCSSIGTAGRQWSYPGHYTDRTPYGVMAHELGHHVDYIKSTVKGAYFGDFSVNLRAASKEPKLTSYCPNDAEWFAEMFRLFVTNSDLLMRMRPKTYDLICEAGLRPVIAAPWHKVLKDAPQRTIDMVAKKLGEAR